MIAEADSVIGSGARTVRIALLGCGIVGSAVARLLRNARDRLRVAHGIDVELTRILVRNVARSRDDIDSSLLTADFKDMLRDDPDVVIEALGGREPASALVETLLRRGISVISANKTLVAHDGPRLSETARQCGARFACEASVGAAIPVLAAIRQRAGDPVIAIRAVLNGTCNFALTHMTATGSTLDAALHEATARGLAEPDPANDISGRDTAEKLCILARAAGFASVAPGEIETIGIENITSRDLQAAREHGCVIRLIAELNVAAGHISPRLRVGPALVPFAHPLAKAKGAENVIVVDQHEAGRLVLQGQGAGPRPTAAAILGDLLSVLEAHEARAAMTPRATPLDAADSRRWFVRSPRAAAPVDLHATSEIDLRRDSVELILENAHDAALVAREASFAAPFVGT